MARKHSVTPKAGYHHGDLRTQLIHASQRLIATSEAGQFTIADACRLAGVSTAAPYRHFASREDLLEAVTIDGVERMGTNMKAALEGLPRGSNAAISSLGKAYIAFAQAEPNLFRMIFQKVEDPARKCRMEQAGENTYGVLLGEIAYRLGHEELNDSVLKLAMPLWAFVHGTSTLLIEDKLSASKSTDSLEATIDRVTSQLLSDIPEPGGQK